jgi:putative toxin-antitoxin system antitoxin component (TIGR02293 family)
MSQIPTIPEAALSISRLDLAAIQQGVPVSALEEFVHESGIDMKSLFDVVISSRTLKRRRQTQKPLNLNESDRLVWIAGTFVQAVQALGDTEKASHWLMGTSAHFEGRTPLSLLRTSVGNRAVKELLRRTDQGAVA